METETTEGAVDTTSYEAEGTEQESDTIAVTKSDYEKMNQTLGSLKRELKDLKKSKEESPKETAPKNQTGDNSLLQKAFLRSAGVSKANEVELALSLAEKWNVPVDTLVDDEDFQVRLEKLRTQEANTLATSNIRAGAGSQSTKQTPEYWQAKGERPTAADVPDRGARAKIIRAMMESSKTGGKKFYND